MKYFLMALLFSGGILLAGSDGAWFPVPNFIGAVFLAVFGLIGSRLEKMTQCNKCRGGYIPADVARRHQTG